MKGRSEIRFLLQVNRNIFAGCIMPIAFLRFGIRIMFLVVHSCEWITTWKGQKKKKKLSHEHNSAVENCTSSESDGGVAWQQHGKHSWKTTPTFSAPPGLWVLDEPLKCDIWNQRNMLSESENWFMIHVLPIYMKYSFGQATQNITACHNDSPHLNHRLTQWRRFGVTVKLHYYSFF